MECWNRTHVLLRPLSTTLQYCILTGTSAQTGKALAWLWQRQGRGERIELG